MTIDELLRDNPKFKREFDRIAAAVANPRVQTNPTQTGDDLGRLQAETQRQFEKLKRDLAEFKADHPDLAAGAETLQAQRELAAAGNRLLKAMGFTVPIASASQISEAPASTVSASASLVVRQCSCEDTGACKCEITPLH